jgi:hypothetical protein
MTTTELARVEVGEKLRVEVDHVWRPATLTQKWDTPYGSAAVLTDDGEEWLVNAADLRLAMRTL